MSLDQNKILWTYKNKKGIISRPISQMELLDLYDKGKISKKTLVRLEGDPEWTPFKETDLYDSLQVKGHSSLIITIIVLLMALFLIGLGAWWRYENVKEVVVEPDYSITYPQAKASLMINGWTITDETVPDFEEVPIPIPNIGFIVKVDGLYGVMGLENEYLVPPAYEAIEISGTVADNTVFYESASDTSKGYSLAYLLGNSEKNEVNLLPSVEGISISSSRNVTLDGIEKSDISSPIAISLNDWWYEYLNGGQKYYIWNPNNDKVFGPFNTDEVVFFTLDDTIQNHTYPVEGLFYVNRDGEYTIYANHGANKTVQTFDFATPVSDAYIVVSKDGQFASIDSSLQATFIGEVEAASAPIKGIDYVKIDGKWYRIYNYTYQNVVEELPTESTENKEDEKESTSKTYILTYNMYVRDAPGGSVVTVTSAGTSLNVVETVDYNGQTWGKLEDGNYVCIFDGTTYYAQASESGSNEDTNNDETNSDEESSEDNSNN
jgi:hypothetical protein